MHYGPYGEIRSSWEKDENKILYNVSIPSNSTATLHLKGIWTVREGSLVSVDEAHASAYDNDPVESIPDPEYIANADVGAQTESIIKLVAGSYVFIIEK